MRIGVAARGLIEASGGVRQYIESLLYALLRVDKTNEYVIYYNTDSFLGKYPYAEEKVLNCKNKIVWDFILLPAALRRDRIDLAFFPKNVVPFFIPCKSVIVNYDFGYFIKGLREYKFFDTVYMRLMMPSSDRRAHGIISVSEYTKKDILKFTKARQDKISVIYLAADESYKVITDQVRFDEVKRKYDLREPFIFYCGSLSPRKNVFRLIKAFDLIKHKIPHQLVFTAGKSWHDKHIYRLIKDLKLDNRVTVLGHVACKDMPVIYNLSEVYVYPSFYEGFGLPVLEAMACGCPVITSNVTSLPEVVGEAAIMVNPYSVEQLGGAIYKVLQDNDCKKKLINKGFQQIKKFSWEKTAYQTLEVFRKVWEGG